MIEKRIKTDKYIVNNKKSEELEKCTDVSNASPFFFFHNWLILIHFNPPLQYS